MRGLEAGLSYLLLATCGLKYAPRAYMPFELAVYPCGGGSRALTTTASRSDRRPPQAGPSVLTISTLAPAACTFIRRNHTVPYRSETIPYRIYRTVQNRNRNRSVWYRTVPYDVVLYRMVTVLYRTVRYRNVAIQIALKSYINKNDFLLVCRANDIAHRLRRSFGIKTYLGVRSMPPQKCRYHHPYRNMPLPPLPHLYRTCTACL